MRAASGQEALALAAAAFRAGRAGEAERIYLEMAGRWPQMPEGPYQLGLLLSATGRWAEAIEAFERVVGMRPEHPQAQYNLGVALFRAGLLDRAIAAYRRAVVLRPDYVMALVNLGSVLWLAARADEAMAAYRQAVKLQLGCAEAIANLGGLLKDQGELDAALEHYDRAIALRPENAAYRSNRAYAVQFHPRFDAAAILREQREWDRVHGEPLRAKLLPHGNERSAERRLKVGYVSPDFREHCQAMFMVPLLANHDRERVEVFCYASVLHPDGMTDRLKGHADVWRDVGGAGDDRLAEIVRGDGIDILVDLTMHMAGNRLGLFARKPAPVQVAWLAYPGTTGLRTMDYRLTDPHLDRVGEHNDWYGEESVRLPETFWCYDSLTTGPAVGALPAKGNGYVTFGCLNNFCKVNDETLALWAKVLTAVAGSRLLMLAPVGETRERVLKRMAENAIEAGRVEFVEHQARGKYLETYQRIDVGLDTLPYNGHTTSLDSYWMGVPVVTLVGKTVVGRAGLSQLSNLGMGELAARMEEEFVGIAAGLAGDLARLSEIRSTLRERMKGSALMDGRRFARNVEQAYREMWGKWCGGGR